MVYISVGFALEQRVSVCLIGHGLLFVWFSKCRIPLFSLLQNFFVWVISLIQTE